MKQITKFTSVNGNNFSLRSGENLFFSFIKAGVLIFALTFLPSMSAYCLDSWKTEPVNVREISLDDVKKIEISFHEENVSLLQGTSDKLIIKEYRNKDNDKFFARVTNSENRLSIQRGLWLSWRLFSIVRSRIEIYLPATYKNEIHVRTTNGDISSTLAKNDTDITLASLDGNVLLQLPKDINCNFSIKTVSGKVTAPFTEKLSDKNAHQFSIGEGKPEKNIALKTTSGAIRVNLEG